MKLYKIHFLITIYFFIITLIYLYNDVPTTKASEHVIFIIVIGIIEIVLLISIIYKLIKNNVIAYSKLFQQILIILPIYFFFQFSHYYFYILIIITILLYIFIKKFHELVLVNRNKEYHLKIRNKFIVNVIYIGYGVISYVLFILSNEDFYTYFSNIEDAFYVVFTPYLIIVMVLYSLQYDNKTDVFQTKTRYIKSNKRKILKRNLLINLLCLLLLIL